MPRSIEQFDNGVRFLQVIAILLVVLGHIRSPLGDVIFSFHMPLFFFLGGLFINASRNVGCFIKANAKRLLIPYIMFGFFGWLVTLFKDFLLHRPVVSIGDTVSGLLYWMDVAHLQHYGFVLWFLPALFWGRILVFMILKYVTNPLMVILFTIVVFTFATSLRTSLPFGLDKGMIGSVWISIGYVFYSYCKGSRLWWSLFGVCVISVCIWMAGIQRLDIASMRIGNPWITLPYTCSVAIIALQLSKVLADRLQLFKSGMVSLLGANTMLIFIAHPYTNNVAHLTVARVTENGWYLEFVLTLALLLVLVQIKKNHPENIFFKHV